jgi:hypothetical protein
MARVPRDFAEQVKRYAARHRQSISELIRDGLVWRIEQDTPGRPWSTCIGMPIDPDDLSVPCNGDTGIQELSPRVYEAIAAAVREAIHPVQESVIQQQIPVLQQDTGDRKNGSEALEAGDTEVLQGMTEVSPHESQEAPDASGGMTEVLHDRHAFDPARFTLGKLCVQGHAYGTTGHTLYRLPTYVCLQCDAARARERRARQKAGKV